MIGNQMSEKFRALIEFKKTNPECIKTNDWIGHIPTSRNKKYALYLDDLRKAQVEMQKFLDAWDEQYFMYDPSVIPLEPTAYAEYCNKITEMSKGLKPFLGTRVKPDNEYHELLMRLIELQEERELLEGCEQPSPEAIYDIELEMDAIEDRLSILQMV